MFFYRLRFDKDEQLFFTFALSAEEAIQVFIDHLGDRIGKMSDYTEWVTDEPIKSWSDIVAVDDITEYLIMNGFRIHKELS
jgi:hypothetical protein